MVSEGKKAPDFKLPDQSGKSVKLSDFRGKNVVLYFYPKDDTPGCTKEACNFRDDLPDFENLNAVIIGISPDPVTSHQKFAKKYDLPFILLSDEDKKVLEDYEVWKMKSMYGRNYMGVERSTFVIDKDGIVKKIFRKVQVDNHNSELLEALQN